MRKLQNVRVRIATNILMIGCGLPVLRAAIGFQCSAVGRELHETRYDCAGCVLV